MILGGFALIGAGLVTFRYASEIAVQVSGFIGSPPEGDATGVAITQGGYLPFLVWGFGFTLIGSGAAMLRSAVFSPSMGTMPGMGMTGMGMAGAGISDEALDAVMQQAARSAAMANVAAAGTAEAEAKEVVKIKCRNCGSLEADDAEFCRKCGKPL